ncbi:MAG: DUF1667 domain-containing protein [Desulfobacteraceae bacterium]|nr:MAG: DUF1667 domain-containing protein [Desulfobacteraceae bacterium]
MAVTQEMICITCPMGCRLKTTQEGSVLLNVDGHGCKRGPRFAKEELTDPRRMVATTVRVRGSVHPLAPVYTAKPFPKPRIFDLLREVRGLEIEAPVVMNQVVLENALGEGINLIASRDMPRVNECDNFTGELSPSERYFQPIRDRSETNPPPHTASHLPLPASRTWRRGASDQ